MKSEEIQKIVDALKKKIESMVWGQVFVNEGNFDSIVIAIYSYKTINCEKFAYAISLVELNHACDYLGPDTYIDLISKRIVDEFKSAMLKLFVKEEYV